MSEGLPDLRARLRIDTTDLDRADAAGKGFVSRMKAQYGDLAKAAGLVFGAAQVVSFFKAGVDSLAELDRVTKQTEAALRSTGNAAGVTAEHVRGLAQSIEDYSAVDDKAVQAGENMLLTFTNVKNGVGAGNQVFDDATKTLIDMSVALGTDAKDSAIQLGKALNDPIAGITALTRVGVTFTAQQKEQIAAMVAAGDTMGAQKVILAELNKEFGGSAKAFGESLPGKIAAFQDKLEDLAAQLVTMVLPVVEKLAPIAEQAFNTFAEMARTVLPVVASALGLVADHGTALTVVLEILAARFVVMRTAAAISAVFAGLASAMETLALRTTLAAEASTLMGGSLTRLSPALLATGTAGSSAAAGIAGMAGPIALVAALTVGLATDMGGVRTGIKNFLLGAGDVGDAADKLKAKLKDTNDVGKNFLSGKTVLGPAEMQQKLNDNVGLLDKFSNRLADFGREGTSKAQENANKVGNAWNTAGAQAQSVMAELLNNQQFEALGQYADALARHGNDAKAALADLATQGGKTADVANGMLSSIDQADAATAAAAKTKTQEMYALGAIIDTAANDARAKINEVSNDPGMKRWATESIAGQVALQSAIAKTTMDLSLVYADERSKQYAAAMTEGTDKALASGLTAKAGLLEVGRTKAAAAGRTAETAKQHMDAAMKEARTGADFDQRIAIEWLDRQHVDAQTRAATLADIKEKHDGAIAAAEQRARREVAVNHLSAESIEDYAKRYAASAGNVEDYAKTYADAQIAQFDKIHPEWKKATDDVQAHATAIGLTVDQYKALPEAVRLAREALDADYARYLLNKAADPKRYGAPGGMQSYAEGGIRERGQRGMGFFEGDEKEWIIPAHKAGGYEAFLDALVRGGGAAGIAGGGAPVAGAVAPTTYNQQQQTTHINVSGPQISAEDISRELAWSMRVHSL